MTPTRKDRRSPRSRAEPAGSEEPQGDLFAREPAGPPGSPAGSRENPFTIAALNALTRALLEERFESVWVVGEVSNFVAHSSGHWYFTLKDGTAELGGVMFARENRRLRFDPYDGIEILARGKLTLYPARGRYQIILEEMLPRREGELMLALRQLEERLRAEGLFDPARRRAIPLVPRRIGVVSSQDGAAFRDILRVLRDRFAPVTVLLRDARVQGEGAAEDIAAGIRDLNEHGLADVLIVGRGGGSIEDLWAFNEEVVVRAIAGSTIPVISAVGHEVDVTLSDLVADLRAPTPSAAAEKVIASREEMIARLSRLRSALVAQARLIVETRRRRADVLARSRALVAAEIRVRDERQGVDELVVRARLALVRRAASHGERLAALAGRLSPVSLLARVAHRGDRLVEYRARLARAAVSRLGGAKGEMSRLAGLLDSLSPLAVLERGYAICFDASGSRTLRDSGSVREGDDVRVRLHRGRLDCRVLRSRQEGP
jgi:exodeoxyribonuclease VII large subunit